MNASYQDAQIAIKYLDFLNSKNGKIQQDTLVKAIIPRLPQSRQALILETGCGPGWLAYALSQQYANIQACDASELFINFARIHYKNIKFNVADLEKPLPYVKESFDAVVANMVLPDIKNLPETFKNITAAIKPEGKIIATVPNPKLTYPAAEWKRTWLDFLLFKKPSLQIKAAPKSGTAILREFGNGVKIGSFYHTLDDYEKSAATAGLKLEKISEIKSAQDSQNFDLTYQLFRYPLFLVLEFKKTL